MVQFIRQIYCDGISIIYGGKVKQIMKKNIRREEKTSKRKWISLFAASFLMAVLLTGCGTQSEGSAVEGSDQESSSATADESDQTADGAEEEAGAVPEESTGLTFTAVDLDGNTITESIFEDKDLTVMNIWGTFCGPCVGEMPALGEWAKEMPDNVQLVGLVIDIAGEEDTEHIEMAKAILDNAGADFAQIIANQDFALILKDVIGVPTTIFIDKDGNVVGDPIVGADVEGYKKFVEEYLNGQ